MNDQRSFGDPKVLLPFLLITLIWGSTWIVIKDQLGSVPPVWSVSYRFLIAGAAMFLLARLTGAAFRIGREGHALAGVMAVLQFAINYNCVYAAEQYITSGLVAVVFALLIVPNALFSRIFFGHRMTTGFAVGSAVALAGVGLLFLQEVRMTEVPAGSVFAGIGLAVLAVLAASIANVMQLMNGIRTRPISVMLGWAMLYGAAIDALFAWSVAGPPVIETRLGYWLGLLYLSVIASSLAFFLYYRIIRAIGPARAAYSSVLIPIIAMGFSTLFEGYSWAPLAAAGGALALAGLVIALRSRPPPAPSPAD
ncbi:MAG TPA: EamA family transporter [Allosphingosinicella sp.]|nr:EamA family transporter [Allosphingosinicella sp.]